MTHYILCGQRNDTDVDRKKRPIGKWKDIYPTDQEVRSHREQGGLVAIEPGQSGLIVLDVDKNDDGSEPPNSIRLLTHLHDTGADYVIARSRRPGGLHVIIRTDQQYSGSWSAFGVKGEIRQFGGYVIMWDEPAWDKALKHDFLVSELDFLKPKAVAARDIEVDSDLVREVVESCLAQVDSYEETGNGWLLMRSPFRYDRSPSFAVSTVHGGFTDFGNGEHGGAYALARRLKISVAPKTANKPKSDIEKRVALDNLVEIAAGHRLTGNDVKGMLNVSGGDSTAVITQLVVMAVNSGELDGGGFTARDVLRVAEGRLDVSKPTVLRGLRQSLYIRNVNEISIWKEKTPGRPAQKFRLAIDEGREDMPVQVAAVRHHRTAHSASAVSTTTKRGDFFPNTDFIGFRWNPDSELLDATPLEELLGECAAEYPNGITKRDFRAWWLRKHLLSEKLEYATNAKIEQATGVYKGLIRTTLRRAFFASKPCFGFSTGESVSAAAEDARARAAELGPQKGAETRFSLVQGPDGKPTNFIRGGGFFAQLQTWHDWKWTMANIKIDLSPDGWICRSDEDLKRVDAENSRLRIAAGAYAENCTEEEYQRREEKRRAKRRQRPKDRRPQLPKYNQQHAYICIDGKDVMYYDELVKELNLDKMYDLLAEKGYMVTTCRRAFDRSGRLAIHGEYTLEKIAALPDISDQEITSTAPEPPREENTDDIPF